MQVDKDGEQELIRLTNRLRDGRKAARIHSAIGIVAVVYAVLLVWGVMTGVIQ